MKRHAIAAGLTASFFLLMGLHPYGHCNQSDQPASADDSETTVSPDSAAKIPVPGGVQDAALTQLLSDELLRHNIPNAVVLWVANGEPGYLYTGHHPDLEGVSPVDPGRSLFRIGSISKPFTGLAALDMVEDGLLDLDTDINQYMEVPLIRTRFDRHITARHLMTHTAGFDDFYINKSTRNMSDRPTLEESVRSMLPAQTMKPGEVSTYSNYGVALLGYVMEQALQKPFDEIVRERLFKPLGMTESTFEPDSAMFPRIVSGWYNHSGQMRSVPFDHIKDVPAGQMLTTANDMLRFMQFITTTGELAAGQEKIQALWRRATTMQFTHHPKLRGGWGFLWLLNEYSGYRTITHDGGYVGVAARLMHFPEHHAALFVFCNDMNFAFISDVTNHLIGHFLPGAAQTPAVLPTVTPAIIDGKPTLNDFAGRYRSTRYSRNSMTKVVVLAGSLGPGGEMKLGREGSYLTMTDHAGNPRRLVRTDTLLFSSIDDDYHLAFRMQDNKITHVFTSGTDALEKINLLESVSFQVPFLAFCMMLFLGIILFHTARVPVRLIRGRKPGLSGIQKLSLGTASLYLMQPVLTFVGGATLEPYEFMIGFAYGVPRLFYIANLFPWLGLAATLLMAVHLFRKRQKPFTTALAVAFILLSFCFFISLNYWNLVGWRF